jgi:hypothetical protein
MGTTAVVKLRVRFVLVYHGRRPRPNPLMIHRPRGRFPGLGSDAPDRRRRHREPPYAARSSKGGGPGSPPGAGQGGGGGVVSYGDVFGCSRCVAPAGRGGGGATQLPGASSPRSFKTNTATDGCTSRSSCFTPPPVAGWQGRRAWRSHGQGTPPSPSPPECVMGADAWQCTTRSFNVAQTMNAIGIAGHGPLLD